KGPGSAPSVPLDTTKGHRDDEKHNIREQAAHGNLTQNTSNRRSGSQQIAVVMGPGFRQDDGGNPIHLSNSVLSVITRACG
ncbi:MAG: hypothetical protein ACK463_09850, partial [Bradyrhizobium sp.]